MTWKCLIEKLKNHNLTKDFFTEQGIKQFKKYLVTGFTTFFLEYSLFNLLNSVFFINITPWGYKYINSVVSSLNEAFSFNIPFDMRTYTYIFSNSIAIFIIFWFNFTVNRLWSFKSKASLKKQFGQYIVLFTFNLFATNFLMYLLSDIGGIAPYLSKIMVMAAVVAWNFIVYKKLIYKN